MVPCDGRGGGRTRAGGLQEMTPKTRPKHTQRCTCIPCALQLCYRDDGGVGWRARRARGTAGVTRQITNNPVRKTYSQMRQFRTPPDYCPASTRTVRKKPSSKPDVRPVFCWGVVVFAVCNLCIWMLSIV